MRNFVQEGRRLELNVGTGKKSGDPITVGEIVGVCVTDADANGDAVVDTMGVYLLTVVAQNYDSTNAVYVNEAISVGDPLYDDNGTLNKNSAGVLFGYALEPVAAGATATIKVKLAAK